MPYGGYFAGAKQEAFAHVCLQAGFNLDFVKRIPKNIPHGSPWDHIIDVNVDIAYFSFLSEIHRTSHFMSKTAIDVERERQWDCCFKTFGMPPTLKAQAAQRLFLIGGSKLPEIGDLSISSSLVIKRPQDQMIPFFVFSSSLLESNKQLIPRSSLRLARNPLDPSQKMPKVQLLFGNMFLIVANKSFADFATW